MKPVCPSTLIDPKAWADGAGNPENGKVAGFIQEAEGLWAGGFEPLTALVPHGAVPDPASPTRMMSPMPWDWTRTQDDPLGLILPQ